MPQSLVAALSAYLETDRCSLGPLEQVALYSFIEAGHFARHLRKMRRLYTERQRTLRAENVRLGVPLGAHPDEAGPHLVARSVRRGAATGNAELLRQLLERVVVAPALSSFSLAARGEGLLLGFTSPPAEGARELGVAKEMLSEITSGRASSDAARGPGRRTPAPAPSAQCGRFGAGGSVSAHVTRHRT